MINLKNKFINYRSPSRVAFIRGFQRSGTNWLCNLLNLHPDINCKGEFHFEHFFRTKDQIINNRFGYFTENPEVLETHFSQFINNIIIKECDNAKVCIDRTPCSLADTYLPNQKFLLITRDGRDCIVSWFYHCLRMNIIPNEKMANQKRLFDKDQKYFELNKTELLEVPGFLKHLSKRWNEMICKDIKLVKNPNVYWVRYEELLLNPNKLRKEIYSFLEVNPKKARSLESNTLPGFKQHNPNSHNRIGQSGRWSEYFTEEQHNWFLSEAQEAINLLNLNN